MAKYKIRYRIGTATGEEIKYKIIEAPSAEQAQAKFKKSELGQDKYGWSPEYGDKIISVNEDNNNKYIAAIKINNKVLMFGFSTEDGRKSFLKDVQKKYPRVQWSTAAMKTRNKRKRKTKGSSQASWG